MAERWPPTLGMIGFDQGTKSAVALAVPPGRVTTEGEQPFAPFPFPGACCYNDGTCDDIPEFDCVAAGGNFQGIDVHCSDTPNPCVGVCCEPTCVDNSTPDSCAADGGMWMDFGTTCADDPPLCPTGACCAEDGSCTITAPTDCAGTYQGNGTVCDPNPCLPLCCTGAFVGFLGVGHYMVKTDHIHRTAHIDPTAFTDGCDVVTDITTTTTLTRNIDGSCSTSVTCSGTSYSYIVRDPTIFSDCSWISDGHGGCTFHKNSGSLGCNIACDELDQCLNCSPSTISDTEQHCLSTPGSPHICSYEHTITLSNPCTP